MDSTQHLPLADIEQIQNEKLRHMLSLCARGSKFYQNQWGDAGIDIASIQTIADLESLPLTHKQELMVAPEDFRLNLPDLPLHERALWEVLYTTGSTADPVPLYNTTYDYHAYLHQSQVVADISGISESDVIANLFPLTPAPMGAFVRSAGNAYAAGATIFAALPGGAFGPFDMHRSLDQAVARVEKHRATILWGVPSYIRRLLIRALELEADLSSVRMCAITGEATSPALREDIRRCLREMGAAEPVIFNRYGSTELGAFAQCQEEGDWHNPAPELQYHEIVDPETGRRLPDGERGTLAVTHLDKRGTALVRFVVGDIVSIDRSPCPHCGRTSERVVGPVVRTKDLIKVKGMLINPDVLLDTLQSMAAIAEFQIVIQHQDQTDPLSMDEMLIRVALQAGADSGIGAEIAAQANRAVNVTPRVEFVEIEEIYTAGAQTKAVRFIDRRTPADSTVR
ncbi:MAG: phenylacetate--CoA ligase family protein [Alphaproteobacteria bacterium]|jgi:phenylacetate-coenzyme A ligase PaaK-like adenylate-forming protein